MIAKFAALCALLTSITPNVSRAASEDTSIPGYSRTVLEWEFNLRPYSWTVQDGGDLVDAQDVTDTMGQQIMQAFSGIGGVKGIKHSRPELGSDASVTIPEPGNCDNDGSAFFPKGELFAPLVADPRWPHFSAAYLRFLDSKECDNVGAVSFGERFALYRRDGPFEGLWQLGIEAAVFSVFNLDAESYDLVNSDFWISFPSVSYRRESFSALIRLFHQSSHLGDEYILRNRPDRVNLSYEGITIKGSYDFYEVFRVYGGGGYLLRREPSDLEPWSGQFGLEFESQRQILKGMAKPVAAIDVQKRQESDWNADLSVRAGIQFERPRRAGNKYQIMLEYYNGHSPNGQFYRKEIEFVGIGTHFYF